MIWRSSLLIFALFIGYHSVGQSADFSASPTSICVGQSVQFTDLSTGAISHAWSFPDGGAGQTSILQNPLITYSNPGVYSVTLTVTGVSTDTEVKTAFITVLSTASVTLTSSPGTDNQDLCVGSFLNQIVYSTLGATGADFSGLPSFMAGNYIPPSGSGPGTITVSGAPSAPGVYPYSFTTTGPNCSPATVTGTVSASNPTTLSVTSGPASQLVCVSTPISNIVFNIGGSPTLVVATGLPAGISGVWSGSTFTISGTPTATGGYAYTVTASGGPCTQVQFSGGLQVDPDIQLNSGPGTTNQTLCVNSPLGNIVYGLGPSITGATVTGLPAGVQGIYNSGQFLITYSPSAIGVFNYTVTTSGGSCGPATTSGTITVHEPATIALNSGSLNNQTLCQGTAISSISYTIGGGGTGGNVTGLPPGITGNYNAGIFTISGFSNLPGTYNYTVSTTGTVCGPQNLTGTLTIHQTPNLQLVSPSNTDNQQICANTPIDTIAYLLTGTSTSTNFLNLPAGVTTLIQGNTIYIIGSPSVVGNFPYTVYTSGGTCPPDSAFGVIATTQGPGSTLISPVGSNNQVLCDGQPIDPIAYSPAGAATTLNAINLPIGVTSNFIGGVLTITGNPTQGGVSNYGIVASGGFCPNDTVQGTISVFSPQINLVSTAGSNMQQRCIYSTIDTIAYVFSGGATGATALNLPSGVTTSIQNDTLYLFGPANSFGVFNYIVHTTGTPCEADSSYGVLTIVDSSGVNLISVIGSDFQIVDQNEQIASIVYVLSGSATSAAVTGLPVGVSSTLSGDTLTITGNSGTIGLYTYTITVSGGTCPSGPVLGLINVIDEIDTLIIFVPNVFTPNNDGENDLWSIQTEHAVKVELAVHNRWGNIIFQSDVPNAVWDGSTKNGSEAKEGVYFYKVLVHGKDGSKTPMQGFFHLTR